MIKIYNCKESCGYTYLWTCNEKMQGILLAYCEGRSFFWNLFFGWRRTKSDNQMFFWIPSNALEELIKIAENF